MIKLTEKDLTKKELKSKYRYHSRNGTWWSKKYHKKRVETFYYDGSKKLFINGKYFSANRLAFLYMLNRFPVGVVKHKNRKIGDDRWSNLYEVEYGLERKCIKNKSKKLKLRCGCMKCTRGQR